MKRIQIGTLLIALLIPLIVGGLSAALSAPGMEKYGTMAKPPLSPPAWVFPVAWTILYCMMGLATYFVVTSNADSKSKAFALMLYAVQLVMNFAWSILFFKWEMKLFAFIWLIVMWLIVILCTFRFFAIDRMAGILMIPYTAWLSFAAYLNMGAYILQTDVTPGIR